MALPPPPCERQEEVRRTTLATINPLPFLDVSDSAYCSSSELDAQPDLKFPDRRLLSLSAYLEEVTMLFLQACNTRSKAGLQSIVEKYVAPTFLVNKSEQFQSLSRDAYVKGKLAFWAENPNFRLQPRNTNAFIEERRGHALVFSTNSITGTVQSRPELTREEVTVNHFDRRKNGDWICTKFETLRGPGHWTFEVGHID